MIAMINRDSPDKKNVVIMANQENPGSELLNRQNTSEISMFIRVHPWLKRKKPYSRVSRV